MGQELEHLTRDARPDDLASLRRLEETLHQAGWSREGRTIREWVACFALPPAQFPQDSEPVAVVGRIGLAAVPALVDTLRAKQLAPWPRKDLRIRSRCLEALGLIQPAPVCVVPVLFKVLRRHSPRIQRQVLALLTKLQPPLDDAFIQAILASLSARHEPLTRLYALHLLTQLPQPLPTVLRSAVLERLGDSDWKVRHGTLRALSRLQELDSEALTALEEQVILDDRNRVAVLRLLARLAPARAFPPLVEEIRRAQHLPENTWPFIQALKALRILAGLGARAESLLPMLGQLQGRNALRVHVEAVADSIVRDSMFQSRPPVSPSALVGNEVASRLVQQVPPPPPESPENWSWALALWADGFLPLGQELCVRMALAAARRVAGLWDDTYPDNEMPRSGLIALEQWVCDPSEYQAEQAVYLGSNVPSQLFCAPEAFSASWAITYATHCVSSKPPPEEWNPEGEPTRIPGGHLGACLRAACRALSGMSVITWALGASEDAPTPLSPEQAARELHKAIVDEVLPWLTGTWDPVAEPLRRRRELIVPPRLPGPLDDARAAGRYPVMKG
jgi:hypothetical protein